MGVVYAAWDQKENKQVAVKRMHSYLKAYPKEYERFREEARIVGELKHPNIVRIFELVEQEGDVYLVFEYVDGQNLYDVLKRKNRFPLQECREIFGGICNAVHYAHENKVIHRDLKLGNIMLSGTGNAMVMDFGLASRLKEGFTRVTHLTSAGTPVYMAPEQYDGIVKRESDIYALGVCLYEMLTGTIPFKGPGDALTLKQKKKKEYREAGVILPWLPSGVDSVISRALDPEPTMRFADALDFWAALKEL